MATATVDQSREFKARPHPLPPGSYGVPFIGQTLEWRRDPLGLLRRRYKRYGRIFKSCIYGYREITMLSPAAKQFILSSGRHHFEWSGGQELILNRKLFGENLFLLDGTEHDRQRNLLMPVFSGGAMGAYFEVIRDLTEVYARRWARRGRIAVFPEMRKLTFEIAARLLLGADTSDQVDYLAPLFHDLTRGAGAFPRWDIPWTRFGRARRAAERLRAYFRAVLSRRRNERRSDALGRLAAGDGEGTRLTDEQIITHLIMLLGAAHDTTTSSLTWLLYELHRPGDVPARLRAELEEARSGSALDFQSLGRLRYHDLVMKELERMHPAVTGGPRRVVKAFDFDGYHVPVGSIVYYSILFTHSMPEVFRDPDRFDPDRFAPPRSEDKRTPFGLIGFGGGPRSCIGKKFARTEMKIILATLLAAYEWRVLAGQDLTASYNPTKCPRSGLIVRFSERGRKV